MNPFGSRPEVLAPAGDWAALRAAVLNGADAVYFGLEAFNARARAANFPLDELPDVMDYLHGHNVRGFVTLNVLIFSNELEDIVGFLKAIAEAGVDAVIVQDLGLVTLIRRLVPSLPIHASTQMTLTESRGIEFVRELGISRVVLARELSIDDIRKITAATDMPLEVFVHGALCVAYSGQCLTSEALGGRSANRGQCAQACRLPYELHVDGQKHELGDKAYLLSPQDLAAYELIAPLIEAGVISFKIEGRLKGGPYVASTTHTYRNAVDAALAKQHFHLERRQELDLAQTFSRGLTRGYLDGVNHQILVRGRFPKSRGIRVGKVFGRHGDSVQIDAVETVTELIRTGDGLLFDLGRPAEQEPGGRVWRVNHDARLNRYLISFEPGSMENAEIPIGCDVWKTDDPVLRKRLEATYSKDRVVRRAVIEAKLSGTLGGPITLELSDTPRDLHVAATWPGPLEVARNRATTHDELRSQLDRLGDTPFELGDVIIELPENVLVPKSVINDLRRQAVASLLEKQRQHRQHAMIDPGASSMMRSSPALPPEASEEPRLTVLVRNLEQLDVVLSWVSTDGLPKPAAVYCDFEDLRGYKEAVARARAAKMFVGLATNRIWKPGEDGFQSMVVRAQPDAVLVRNLASIQYFREELPGAQLLGDFSLNVANELTADVLFQSGLTRLVPSFDMNWQQFEAMMRRADSWKFEAVVHQHMPMFHNEFCLFAAFLSTGKDHTDCGRPCDRHKLELRDRTGAMFPVLPDTGCRNTVYHSMPQSAAEYVGRMRQLGLRWFRVDLLKESAGQIAQLLGQYSRVIHGSDDGRQTWKNLKAMNQLGVTRGTLNIL